MEEKKDNKVVECMKSHKKEIACAVLGTIGGVAAGYLIGKPKGVVIDPKEMSDGARRFFADMARKGVNNGYYDNGPMGKGYMLSELGKYGEFVMNELQVEDCVIEGVIGFTSFTEK